MADNRQLIAAILLAAGSSSRLGRPKQLLEIGGKTLIRRAAETLLTSGCSPIVVVLGAEIKRSKEQLDGLSVEILINDDWQAGMSSSLRAGLERLENLGADAALISLCDQPFIQPGDIVRLIDAFGQADTDIAAAFYAGRLGVPAIFPSRFFADLKNIKGDRGAREILAERGALAVPMENALVDIDTETDLATTSVQDSYDGLNAEIAEDAE